MKMQKTSLNFGAEQEKSSAIQISHSIFIQTPPTIKLAQQLSKIINQLPTSVEN